MNEEQFEKISLFHFLTKTGKPLPLANLIVNFNPSNFSRPRVSQDLEDEIDRCFLEITQANPRIYNGTKFRLDSFEVVQEEDKIKMNVGLTDYRELMGTHYSPRCQEFVDHALSQSPEADKYRFMGNTIGVGAITVTSDSWIVLVKRAQWTGEDPGLVDRPGGHPEPDNVLKEMEGKTIQQVGSEAVWKEIVRSPQDELRDEVNIPLEHQIYCGLLGLVRRDQFGGRPVLEFLVELDLTKETVQEKYSKGNQEEADESEHLVWLPVEDVRKWSISSQTLSDMTDTLRGSLRLFHRYLSKEG